MQRILVIQQKGRAEPKIKWIRAHGQDMDIVQVVDLEPDLPQVIDEPDPYLPSLAGIDLVIDYLLQPDLTEALAQRCAQLGIPVVASGRRLKVPGLHTPPTCCGLAPRDSLGNYGRQFGAPEVRVEVADGCVSSVEVVRGSPCGSTWESARKIVGLPIEEALTRFGLEVQLHCQADPASWDPIYGKSPVHFAADIHAAALRRALAQAERE